MILWVFLFYFQTVFAQEVRLDTLPTDKFYVYYDQNYNVWRRIKNALKEKDSLELSSFQQNGLGDVWMSEADKEPERIYLIELHQDPQELAVLNLNPTVDLRLTGPNKNRIIPVLAEDLNRYQNIGTVIGESLAYKLLGRNSWYLAPTHEGWGGVFFKKIQNIPLYRDKADRAIFMVDYLMSGLHLLPPDLQDSFLPEQIRTTVSTNYFSSDIFVFRSAEDILATTLKSRILPLHGLLGTDLSGKINNLKAIARLGGLSEKEWKKKYLYPKLARLTAYLHLVLGVSLENHTQNVLAEVDMQTGELKRLILRDLGDGIMNPIVRTAWGDNLGSLSTVWTKTRFKNLAYHSWIEPAKRELSNIGFNTAVYTGQSLDSHGRTFRERLEGNIEFINHYLKIVGEITGQQIRLSETSEQVLNSIQRALKTEDIYEFKNSPRGRIDTAVAYIVEDIYQQGLDQLLDLKMSLLGERINFKEGKKRFLIAMADQRMAFRNSEAQKAITPWLQTTWLGEKVSTVAPWLSRFSNVPREVQFFEESGQLRIYDNQGQLLAVEFINEQPSSLSHIEVILPFSDLDSSKICIDFLN